MKTSARVLFKNQVERIKIDLPQSEKEAIIQLVLEHFFGLSRTDLIREKEGNYDERILDESIDRLNNHEPVQYVLGEAFFYGRKLNVNSSVLIPRPETELLIQLLSEKIGKRENITVVDVGTGSGCIAITASLEFPSSKIYATDISEQALQVAKDNAWTLDAPVEFLHHDILNSHLPFKDLDFIVSNPPYIAENEKESMNANVVKFEPSIALFVEHHDPLKFYRALATQSISHLKEGGYLITEINERFGQETADVFRSAGLTDPQIIKDIDGKDRFVSGKKFR